MKKIVSILLTVALIITLVPLTFLGKVEAATQGTYFIFNEQYDVNSPRIVNKDTIDKITGTLNNVSPNSVNYSVYQLTADGKETSNKRENVQEGLSSSASVLSVVNLKLFPGLNKVTFKGRSGSADVTESIYFEYRDSPMLYDVKVSLSGKMVDLAEDQPAVVMATKGSTFFEKDSADVSITGYAPGAESVTVQVNGTANSWTYPVNSYNNYQFYASPVNIRSGKNLITIIVTNKNQKIETTREVTFYNGKTTFFDTFLSQSGNKSLDMSNNPDFNGDRAAASTVTGKVIVPQDPTLPVTQPDINYSIAGGTTTPVTTVTILNAATAQAQGYLEVEFSFVVPANTFAYDNLTTITLSTTTGSKAFGITFRDASKAYIYKVNYLSGYTPGMTPSQIQLLTGTDLSINKNVFSLPAAFEVLVVNGTSASAVTVDSDGNSATVNDLGRTNITENINGVPTTITRVLIEVENLYKFGEQTLNFKLNGGSPLPVPITLLYGPSVKFAKLFEDVKVYMDPMDANLQKTVLDELGNFEGELLNIANTNDIVYSGTNRTVFLYVNNTLVDLVEDPNSNSKNKFKIAASSEKAAFDALMLGANNIRFEFKGKSTYTMNIKVNYIPKDSPSIPATENDGVFPFTFVNLLDNLPAGKDSNFEQSGSVYLTKKRELNVYGTFNFVTGLGTTVNDVQNNIQQLSPNNYILKITTPEIDGQNKTFKWNLSNELKVISSGAVIGTINQGVKPEPLLDVYYDVDKQYFKFILRDQKIPNDGSPRVYSISVYNAGEGGAAATYRLEVNPITEPFNVVRPLPQKRIVNQNFVEVIVYSEHGSKVMIGKEEAEKTSFTDYNNNQAVGYDSVFRALVKDLKPNKDTKINIAVTVGDEVITDYITVRYVPANIPGAQYMESMKSSHKLFENAVSLKFPKDTTLIRRDYNAAENLKGQVYPGHDILFSIANGQDGIVDRHDFEQVPPGYDNEVNEGISWFNLSFPRRFVKSSPVFWIDGGLADDPATVDYDPIKYGSDPYQFRNPKIAKFYNRNPLLELIPSKRGTLTLTYDSSITDDTGRLITVFYYNPELKQWENLGGIVDPKKHTIEVPFDRFGYYTVAKLSYSYNDINQHQYARDYMETVFAKGIMNASDPAQLFGADSEYVSRGEFTRMVVKAKNLPLNYLGTQHFSDLSSDVQSVDTNALWDFRYIETAARAGITRGVRPQVFDPNNSISRQDAAVMIAKALNLKLETDRTKIKKDLSKYYKDYESIDYYAQSAVAAVTKKGFMQGTLIDPADPKRGSMFNPTSRMLRGDGAILIGKVMADQKLLPKIQ